MRRYAKAIGSVGIGSAAIAFYLLIRTDEVPHHEVLGAGFEEVTADLSDDEAMKFYGVTFIHTVTDERTRRAVN